ncbi:hypothetical protein EJ06DRAFT_242593 [Trichodelitschia bisporula]|uniref:Uncharacterized protein n=1 Tax=Trichodelitschia bisporula TaxID=703511 RepID=A0A6G1HJY7_9PEZI|nr:hypothetical protein EJ06DRAFT_242593 [Trichodelitschia bisporula]
MGLGAGVRYSARLVRSGGLLVIGLARRSSEWLFASRCLTWIYTTCVATLMGNLPLLCRCCDSAGLSSRAVDVHYGQRSPRSTQVSSYFLARLPSKTWVRTCSDTYASITCVALLRVRHLFNICKDIPQIHLTRPTRTDRWWAGLVFCRESVVVVARARRGGHAGRKMTHAIVAQRGNLNGSRTATLSTSLPRPGA